MFGSSSVARNLIWGVYVLTLVKTYTPNCNFKTCVNVPHVNKTVTDLGGIYSTIYPGYIVLYIPPNPEISAEPS